MMWNQLLLIWIWTLTLQNTIDKILILYFNDNTDGELPTPESYCVFFPIVLFLLFTLNCMNTFLKSSRHFYLLLRSALITTVGTLRICVKTNMQRRIRLNCWYNLGRECEGFPSGRMALLNCTNL